MKKRIKVEAVLLKANTPNLNGRTYSEECLRQVVEDFNAKKETSGMFGELVHDDYGRALADFQTVDLSNIACYAKDVKKEGDLLKVELVVADTEKMQNILEGPKQYFVCRPRSIGSVDTEGNVTLEKIISYDIIPAHTDSFRGVGKFSLGLSRWKMLLRRIGGWFR